MRYWFDTEFIEDGKTIDLLSIGIVAEDGRELYLENCEADLNKADGWVRANVFPNMLWSLDAQRTRKGIAHIVRRFCDPERCGTPEFWAYYADYDWVVMCQLFGRMIDVPNRWPKFCLDFKQLLSMRDPSWKLRKLPKDQAHNALVDARWLRDEWRRFDERFTGR